ncbi:hypothetical protein TUMEXPCC7403_10365 [Tumidithrix helvetica PCC 7403]|uniref:hypothetical protein n=1 Tax=Tumidithrix helvetica TaxID=3457545 RepID=UPI003CB295F7
MAFQIELDFSRYPSTLFGGQLNVNLTQSQVDAQKVVKDAADTWAKFILDDFAQVSEGVTVDLISPITGLNDTFTLPTAIDDLRIYVSTGQTSAGAETSVGSATKGSFIRTAPGVDYGYLDARRYGINAEPFVASILFSNQLNYFSTFGVVPSNQVDLYTIALHEIGHALGFYKDDNNNPPIRPTAFSYGISGNSFVGLNLSSPGIQLESINTNAGLGNHFFRTFDSSGNVNINSVKGIVVSTRSPTLRPNGEVVTYTNAITGQLQDDLMGAGILGGSIAQTWGITDNDLKFLADVGYNIDNSKVDISGFSTTNIPLDAPAPSGNFLGYIIGGTKGDDTIKGNIGNDTLAGGPGNDMMTGGLGDDTYYVDSIDDKVTEQTNQGNDTIVATGDLSVYNFFSLPANRQNVEKVIDSTNKKLALSGGNNNTDTNAIISLYSSDKNGWEVTTFPGGNDDIKTKGLGNTTVSAGDGNDIVFGGDGSDRLSGDAGDDILVGGSGSDTIFGGSSSGFNTLVGFDIGSTTGTPILTPNQVDTLTHSSNSSNIFVLSSGGVNAYTAGNDYARIVGWTSQSTNPAKFDRLKVASSQTKVMLRLN